jgi:hypothetical protein
MARTFCTALIALSLIGAGWTIGQAQSRQPDFELIVNAPGGDTTIECVRGAI